MPTFTMTPAMIAYHEDTVRREQMQNNGLTVGQGEYLEQLQKRYQEGKTEYHLLQVLRRKSNGTLFLLTSSIKNKAKKLYRLWDRGEIHPWPLNLKEMEVFLDLSNCKSFIPPS